MTEIRRAAMRQRANRPEETFEIPAQPQPIQPGYSVDALRKTAMELIAQAELKLDIRAYLSAEEKAKKALELIAQSIDSREQSALATRDLMIALTAIREAEDFVGKYGMVDGESITRMVRSHSTEVLKPYDVSKLNGLAAADVYLDWSRRCLMPLAVADPLAADAIRILAKSHRLRDDGTPYGIATSVHLIRAAAEGSPNNRQVRIDYETTLHVAGLTGDSMVAQVGKTDPRQYAGTTVSTVSARSPARPEHSIASANVDKGPPSRDVKIVEVTPEQFAAISPATSGPPGLTGSPQAQSIATSRQNASRSLAQNNQPSATYRPEHVDEVPSRQVNAYQGSPYQSAEFQEADNSVKSRLNRAFNPITRHFR
ncbi:MAG TPA: hypothetical protein DDZ51_22400 [Planctomycetaceae bacterium]|nr:hypothetical protein [Planctomycetaceae bacterium]